MKILFVGYFTAKGGSAKATIPLALKLRSQGHQVSFAHWAFPESQDLFTNNNLLDFSVHQQPHLLGKIIYLAKIAKEQDLIIAVSELTITYACQLAGWLTGTPVLGEIQVNLDLWTREKASPLHHQLSRFFYPQLTAVRCVSDGLKTYAISRLKVPAHKIFTVYNPFDLETIKSLSQKPLPAAVSHWFNEPVIIALGRLEPQKRFDLAINGINLVIEEYQRKVNLIILGEGSEQYKLQQQIAQLKLENRVLLAGFYENPYPFLAAANLFLLTSDYEGFGRVIVDAMAVGCPVIAYDCPFGPSEILGEGKYGLLINHNSPEAIAQAIISLLNNPQKCSELATLGLRRSLDFAENVVTQNYIAELSRLGLLAKSKSSFHQ